MSRVCLLIASIVLAQMTILGCASAPPAPTASHEQPVYATEAQDAAPLMEHDVYYHAMVD
jgi:hypothetical protein